MEKDASLFRAILKLLLVIIEAIAILLVTSIIFQAISENPFTNFIDRILFK